MSQYFLRLYKTFGRGINVKVDLCNYVKKQILKNQHELIHIILE